jgi:hypothetical protein
MSKKTKDAAVASGTGKLKRKDYEEQLRSLHVEMVKLQ